MNLLIIKDDKPGHYNQSEGISKALEHLYSDLKVERIEVQIKNKLSRLFLKYILNFYTSFFSNEENLKYLKYFFTKFSIPKTRPDLIISTGGNTVNLNAWLRSAYQSKNIFNGRLRGQKEELFTCITTVIPLGYQNEIVIDVAPSVITQDTHNTNLFIQTHNLNEKYYTLLIGGDGAGYKYDSDFYSMLKKFVKNTSKTDNIKWLISTSRRTPLDIEENLQQELSEVSAYFVAYNEQPQKVLNPFLQIGEKIFVTEDSASMISEAITSRKPVFTIYENSTQDNNYNKILNKFENEKKIRRVKLSQKPHIDTDFNIPKEEYANLLAQKIKKAISHE